MGFDEMPLITRHFYLSTVVGYGPSELQESGITAGASFVPMSAGAKVDLADIIVKGYEEEGFCDAGVNVQTLNNWGGTEATYTWYDSGDGSFYGWYADGAEEPIEKGVVLIQPGEGLWLFSQTDGYSLQSSGEVPTTADIVVTLQESGLSVANPTPVTVDLADTYITGYEADGFCDAGVNVQTLNNWGGTESTYTWYDSGDGSFYGWYPDGSEEPIARGVVTIKPGEGLWTFSQTDGFYFNWPKVDVK